MCAPSLCCCVSVYTLVVRHVWLFMKERKNTKNSPFKWVESTINSLAASHTATTKIIEKNQLKTRDRVSGKTVCTAAFFWPKNHGKKWFKYPSNFDSSDSAKKKWNYSIVLTPRSVGGHSVSIMRVRRRWKKRVAFTTFIVRLVWLAH